MPAQIQAMVVWPAAKEVHKNMEALDNRGSHWPDLGSDKVGTELCES
jgi:hypothetical protein